MGVGLFRWGAWQSVNYGFMTEWTVSGDATARTITLPLHNAGTFDCTVDWGDGTAVSAVTAYDDADRIHTYASNGTYTVTITGDCPSWSFNNGGDKLKITDILYWGDSEKFGGFGYLTGGFYGCTNLKSLGSGEPIPKSGTGCTNFQSTFRDCSNASLTSIPSGLFSLHTNVAADGFYTTFYSCTALTAIPSGLFDNNTAVSTDGFRGTFSDCTALTAIPSGLFDNNTAVSTRGFFVTFYNCNKITAIPSGLFDNNTAVSTDGFYGTFAECTALTAIPSELFTNNTSCTSWAVCFSGCNKAQLNKDIFFDSTAGEEATRFTDKSINFQQCFQIAADFTGTQGTAPELWKCDFGTGTPTRTNCFGNTDARVEAQVDNFCDIPGSWNTQSNTDYTITFSEDNALDDVVITVYCDAARTRAIGSAIDPATRSNPITTAGGGTATIPLKNDTYYFKAVLAGHDDYTGDFTVAGAAQQVDFEMVPE